MPKEGKARMPKTKIQDWNGRKIEVDRVFAMEHPDVPGWPIYVQTKERGAPQTFRLEMGNLRPLPAGYTDRLRREGKLKEMPDEYAEPGILEAGCIIADVAIVLLRHERWDGVYGSEHVEFWTVEGIDCSDASLPGAIDGTSGAAMATVQETYRLRVAALKGYHRKIAGYQRVVTHPLEIPMTFGLGEFTPRIVGQQRARLAKEIDRQHVAEAKALEREDPSALDPSSFAKLFSAHLKKNT